MNEKIIWKDIDQDDVNFAFAESKELLHQTITFNDGLMKKAFALLSIFIVFIGGLSSFIFINDSPDTYLKLVCMVFLGGFMVGFFFLLSAVKTGKFSGTGQKPSLILSARNNNEKKDYLYMLQCELLSYDDRVEENLKRNKICGKNINMALYSLYIGFTLSFLLMAFI